MGYGTGIFGPTRMEYGWPAGDRRPAPPPATVTFAPGVEAYIRARKEARLAEVREIGHVAGALSTAEGLRMAAEPTLQ